MWTEQQADREAEELARRYCDDGPFPPLRLRADVRDTMARDRDVITLIGCEITDGMFGPSIRLYLEDDWTLTFTGSDWRMRHAQYLRRLTRKNQAVRIQLSWVQCEDYGYCVWEVVAVKP